MIVLDMDDTLLSDEHIISERNREAIQKAQEKGIFVVLASGRPTGGMIEYAKDLNLDTYNSFIISYNGGQILEVSKEEVIFEETLSVENLHSIYDYSKETKTNMITYKQGVIIGETEDEFATIEKELTGLQFKKVENFKEFVNKPCVKTLLLGEPIYLKKVYEDAKNRYPLLNITMSKPFFLEIMPEGIDKSTSIERLIKQLNIHKDEVMAIGNAGNDLGMIKFAGIGVWVENADEDLKPQGNVIVSSNNNDGVAEAIEKFAL